MIRHHPPFPFITIIRSFATAALASIALIVSVLLHPASALTTTTIKMVEGHSVHRIASRFRSNLVGRKFAASSPNGRFADGAAAIDGRVLSRMEAVGKNLFAFFRDDDEGEEEAVVVHVHFGMSGVWAVYDKSSADEVPEVKPTTRLRLEEITSNESGSRNAAEYVTHLSAMTVAHGTPDLYSSKKATLGQDPLRYDADPELLYSKISKSKKSIGKILMDQSYFAGPGNIYRAEILFLAGVYPTAPGMNLDRPSFDRVWNVSVSLLRRGYDTGSILTVDPILDPHVARRGERRYIYNRSACARCGGEVSSWDMAGRTCYACEGGGCQPKIKVESRDNGNDSEVAKKEKAGKGDGRAVARGKETKKAKAKQRHPQQHVPFISHCAPINIRRRLDQGGAERLTIVEIRSVMEQIIAEGEDDLTDNVTSLPPKSARKAVHIEALNNLLRERGEPARKRGEKAVATAISVPLPPPVVSAEEAAREKAVSGENRAVEHIAELSREQAVSAISITPAAVKRIPKKRKKKKTVDVRPENESGGNERTSQKDSISESLPPPVVSSDQVAREQANKGDNRAVEHVAEPSREQALSAILVTPMPAPVKRIPRKRKKKKMDGVRPKDEMDSHGRSIEQNVFSESLLPPTVLPEEAAREKGTNGENRAHVVELSREQTASVLSVTPSPAPMKRIPRKRKNGRSVGVQPKNEIDGNERSSRQKRLKL